MIGPAAKMNSQENRVNDYGPLSHAVIDLRLAMVSVFIDAIVYLFGARRLRFQSDGVWNKMKQGFFAKFACNLKHYEDMLKKSSK